MAKRGINLNRIYNRIMGMDEEEFFAFLQKYQERLSEENIMMLIDKFLLNMQMSDLEVFSSDWLAKTCDWIEEQRSLVRENIIDDFE